MENIKSFHEFISEKKKWTKDASKHIHKSKMHRILNIPEGEKISSKYDSGKSLLDALIKKVGEAEAVKMVNFAANVNSGSDQIFKEAETEAKKRKEHKNKK